MITKILSFSLIATMAMLTMSSSQSHAGDVITVAPAKAPRHFEKRALDRYYTSVIALDLDGDGIELTDIKKSSVYWNGNNDDFSEECAWVKPDDGLLAIDINSDFVIETNAELFGSTIEDGFSKLSLYDQNRDGLIDASDPVWPQLLVWRDADTDGYSGTTELRKLEKYGITNIDLNSAKAEITDAKNIITHTSTYLYDRAPGQGRRAIVNVRIPCGGMNSVYTGSFEHDFEALQLPDLRGYGTLPSLYVAMTKDKEGPASLLSLVSNLSRKSFEELFSVETDLDEEFLPIMYRWAHVESVDPVSRGPNIDARALAYMEKLTTNNFRQHGAGGTPNPLFWGAYSVRQGFNMILLHQQALFIMQGDAKQLYTGSPSYINNAGIFTGVTGLNSDKLNYLLSVSKDLSPERKDAYWRKILQLIDGSFGIKKLPVTEQAKLEATVHSSGAKSSYQELVFLLQFVSPIALDGQNDGGHLVSSKTVNSGNPNKILAEARQNSPEDQVVVSGIITELIKSCCRNEKDLISFYKQHRYRVYDITTAYNQKKEFGVEDLYSKIIQAHRPMSFFDRFKKTLGLPYNSYDMIAFIKDDSVQWVYAHVQTKRPPGKPL